MARVLPKRYKPPTRARRRVEPGLTGVEQAMQGIQLAGGIANLAGGIGKLVYPGGIPAAISDAASGGPSEEDRQIAAAEAWRTSAREAAAGGGIGPGGAVMGAMPITTGEEMPEQVQSMGPLGRAFRVEQPPTPWEPGGDMADVPTGEERRGWVAKLQHPYGRQEPVPAPQTRVFGPGGGEIGPPPSQAVGAQAPGVAARVVDVTVPIMAGGGRAGMYRDMAAQDPGLTPKSVQAQIEATKSLRKTGGRGLEAGTTIQLSTSPQPAAPQAPGEAPEPTPEQPAVVGMDRFLEAARAAKAAGRGEEFGRWSAMAITKGALQIPDLSPSAKIYLERVLGAQERRMKSPSQRIDELKEMPKEFGGIYSRIVSSRSPDEVRALLKYASDTQPSTGIREKAAGIKHREMERIEEAAQKQLAALEADFPGVNPEAQADIGYREARKAFYTPKERLGGGGPATDKFRVSPLLKSFNALEARLVPAKLQAAHTSAQKRRETAADKLSSNLASLPKATEDAILGNPAGAKGILKELGKSARDALAALGRTGSIQQKYLELFAGTSAATMPKFDLGNGIVIGGDFKVDMTETSNMDDWEAYKEALREELRDLKPSAAMLTAIASAAAGLTTADAALKKATGTRELPVGLSGRLKTMRKRFAALRRGARLSDEEYDALERDKDALERDLNAYLTPLVE